MSRSRAQPPCPAPARLPLAHSVLAVSPWPRQMASSRRRASHRAQRLRSFRGKRGLQPPLGPGEPQRWPPPTPTKTGVWATEPRGTEGTDSPQRPEGAAAALTARPGPVLPPAAAGCRRRSVAPVSPSVRVSRCRCLGAVSRSGNAPAPPPPRPRLCRSAAAEAGAGEPGLRSPLCLANPPEGSLLALAASPMAR